MSLPYSIASSYRKRSAFSWELVASTWTRNPSIMIWDESELPASFSSFVSKLNGETTFGHRGSGSFNLSGSKLTFF
ncbi:uncharacterized protein METZ01_LOCUS140 [marine metagenome]|uniref:Uncharacterized protein n=1 Tax=marine metagenome TaxID=408172 RepID=A0A381MY92_9ZZZZ